MELQQQQPVPSSIGPGTQFSINHFVEVLFQCQDPDTYYKVPVRLTATDLQIPGVSTGEILMYIYSKGAQKLFGESTTVIGLTEYQKRKMSKYMRCLDVLVQFHDNGSRIEFHPLPRS